MSAASLRGPLLAGIAGAAAATLLHVRDPHTSGSYGFCPFLAITGRPCPGCGGLRAINDLTHGDLAAAVSSNVLAVALVVVLTVAWARWTFLRLRGGDDGSLTLGARGATVVLAVVAAFGIVRLTPWGAWLQP